MLNKLIFVRNFSPNYLYHQLRGENNILTEIHHILSLVNKECVLQQCSNVRLLILLQRQTMSLPRVPSLSHILDTSPPRTATAGELDIDNLLRVML